MHLCRSLVGKLMCVVGLAVVSYCFVAFFLLQSDTILRSDGLVRRPLYFLYQNGSHTERLVITIRATRPSSVILNRTVEDNVNLTEARTHSLTLSSVPKARGHSPTLSSVSEANAHSPTLSSVPQAKAHLQTLSSVRKARDPSPTLLEAKTHSPTLSTVPEARSHSPTLSSVSEAKTNSPTLSSVPKARGPSLTKLSASEARVKFPTLSTVPETRTQSPTLSSVPQAKAHLPMLFSVPNTRGHFPTMSSLPKEGAQSPTLSSVPTLWSAPESCKEDNCAEFLSKGEKIIVSMCKNEVRKKLADVKMQNGTCKFLPGVGRSPVMLVSAEGSGNTWLRGLLEKATGVCTGFRWCDLSMRARGFVGEGVNSGKVLVIKTHENTIVSKWLPSLAKSAVFLLRNPAHSLIAERNRRVSLDENLSESVSHTNVVSKDLFVNKSENWDRFSRAYMYQWRLRLTNWILDNDRYPVHVVRYEDLRKDRVKEVEKILDFLHFSYKHKNIVSALEEDYSVFQRTHNHKQFQHYSAEQKENIRSTIQNMTTLAGIRGKADLLRLDEYLESLPGIE